MKMERALGWVTMGDRSFSVARVLERPDKSLVDLLTGCLDVYFIVRFPPPPNDVLFSTDRKPLSDHWHQ
jgi:hypothetical protein